MRAQAAHSSRKASVAFVPPKPNEFDSAARIFICAPRSARSRIATQVAIEQIGGQRCTWSRSASTVNTASTAGGVEQMSVIDLVDDTPAATHA
jgi:ornithine carbamoyltransferase